MQSVRSNQFHVTFYGLNETQTNEKKILQGNLSRFQT